MKVIATIPARLNSKRFPKKLMKEIAGKPVLTHTIERVKRAKKVDEIWIVTPKAVDNEDIWHLAKRLRVGLYAGEEIDIISRILIVANQTKADYIVNVDGEQPLTDPRLIDKCVEILQLGYQFVGLRGMPLGLTPIGFSRDWLKEVYAKNKTETDEEWWKLFQAKESYCVDTEDDFERIKELIESGAH